MNIYDGYCLDQITSLKQGGRHVLTTLASTWGGKTDEYWGIFGHTSIFLQEGSVFFFYLPGNRGWLLQNAFMDGSAAVTGQVQSPAGFFHALLAECPAKSSSDLSSYRCCPECLPTGAGEKPEEIRLTHHQEGLSFPPSLLLSLPLFLYLLLFFFSTPFSLPLSFLFWNGLM